MFEKVIGYTDVIDELKVVADVLRDTEKYKKAGAHPYKTLMFYGPPGVGKTLMCEELVKASGREVFRVLVSEGHEELPKVIKQTFDKAAEKAPSIVFLDDMDKMIGTDDNSVADAIQNCMESCKESEVFVLATCNETYMIPESLMRPGRFGYRIFVNAPRVKDSAAIIAKYMEGYSVENISSDTIAHILAGHTCATLEEVLREAKIQAVYESHGTVISRENMIASMLKVLTNKNEASDDDDPDKIDNDDSEKIVAYHEAGHVVANLLFDQEISLATILSSYDNGGLCVKLLWKDVTSYSFVDVKKECCGFLGGKIGSKLGCGIIDTGCSSDMNVACSLIHNAVCKAGAEGNFYSLWDGSFGFTELAPEHHDKIVSKVYSTVDELEEEVEAAMKKHRPLLDAIAAALLEKKTIIYDDICEIVEKVDPKIKKK